MIGEIVPCDARNLKLESKEEKVRKTNKLDTCCTSPSRVFFRSLFLNNYNIHCRKEIMLFHEWNFQI